ILWFHSDAIRRFNSEHSNLLTCFDVSKEKEFHLLHLTYQSLGEVRKLLYQLSQTQMSKEFGSDMLEQALLVQLMVLFNRLFLQGMRKHLPSETFYDKRIQELLTYINHHLQEDLSIETLAARFYVSKYYLMRRFKEQTGSSIHHYVLQKRLILAKSLVIETESMMDVCLQCGFKDY